MAYSYNAYDRDPATYQFYDLSANTYTNRDKTTGDYFDNNAAVGDFLYIVYRTNSSDANAGLFRNVQFYVGTALVADAITVAYDGYHDVGGWIDKTSEVTDNTNIFRNTGTQTITFNPNKTWSAWIGRLRVRITAVTNITEGGANSTNAVKLGNNKLMFTSGATALSTVYADNITNSWDIFDTITVNNRVYTLYSVTIQIDSGAELTISGTNDESLHLNNRCDYASVIVNGTLTVGRYDTVRKIGYGGGTILDTGTAAGGSKTYRWASAGAMVLYGMNLESVTGYMFLGGNLKTVDSYINTLGGEFFIAGTPSITRTKFRVSNFDIRTTANEVIAGIDYFPTTGYLSRYINVASMTAALVHICGSFLHWFGTYYILGSGNGKTVNVRDCDVREWGSGVYKNNSTNTPYNIRRSVFLKVTDSAGVVSGATVAIKDQGGTTVASGTTNADGYFGESGTASSGDAVTINDTAKTWTANAYQGLIVYVYAGTGEGQSSYIQSNTATALNLTNDLVTAIDNTSKYVIIPDVISRVILTINHTYVSPTTENNPFTIEVSKDGYAAYSHSVDLEDPENYFEMTKPYTLTAKLFPPQEGGGAIGYACAY